MFIHKISEMLIAVSIHLGFFFWNHSTKKQPVFNKYYEHLLKLDLISLSVHFKSQDGAFFTLSFLSL